MKTIFKSAFAVVTAFATLSHVSAFSSHQPNPFGRPQQLTKTIVPGLATTTSFSTFGRGRGPARGIKSVPPLSMASIQDTFTGYPEDMSPEEERDFLRKVAEEYFADAKDAPDLNELMKAVEVSQERPEVEVPPLEIGIEAVSCSVAIAIDTVALILGVIGLRGSASKTVATKMYEKLPDSAKNRILRLLGDMSVDNFADIAWDIFLEIWNGLSWNALKDSFSELGWYDAITFSLAFASIFASGGVAFAISIALLAADFTMLIINISKCDEF